MVCDLSALYRKCDGFVYAFEGDLDSLAGQLDVFDAGRAVGNGREKGAVRDSLRFFCGEPAVRGRTVQIAHLDHLPFGIGEGSGAEFDATRKALAVPGMPGAEMVLLPVRGPRPDFSGPQ